MSRKGIFGGTFDPVHKGHIGLAYDAMEQMMLDTVIFVPAKLQPFKLDKKVTESNRRIDMLNIAIDNPNFEISTWEIDQDEISYSYLTMQHFKKVEDENTELYFICGTDSLLNMRKWKESESFISDNKIIVGSRPNYREKELEEEISLLSSAFDAQIYKVNNTLVNISSTEIREAIQKNDEEQCLDKKVLEYIKENGLYR